MLAYNSPTHAEDLSVILIGSISPEYKQLTQEMGIDSMVHILSKATYIESLRYADSADVLLLVDTPSSTPYPYLPSKLIDYLMFKKPIVGITPIHGAPADLLRELECTLADPNDIDAIYDILLKTINLWRKKELKVNLIFKETSINYSMETVGQAFGQMIGQII